MAVLSKSSTGQPATSNRRTWLPLIFASISGSIALATLVIAYPFIKPAFRRICLPYVPATDTQVENVVSALKSLNLTPMSSSVVDLGSGDGRLVLAAAKLGFKSTGVELNPWLIYWSRLMARKERVEASFIKSDLFRVNLSHYNIVIIFGVDSMMSAVEKMIQEKASQNSNIIACRFPLPNAVPKSTVGTGIDTVWLYDVPLMNKIGS